MPPYLARDFTVTADVDIPQGGTEGMLITEGGRFNGWGLYLLKGKPVFTYNMVDLKRFRWEGTEALPPGRHTVVFDFQYDGPGLAKGGTGVLTVDEVEVAKQTIPHTVPAVEAMDEWLDVGYDTRTGVDDRDYKPPFCFTGTIHEITFKPGPPEMTEAEMQKAAKLNANGRDYPPRLQTGPAAQTSGGWLATLCRHRRSRDWRSAAGSSLARIDNTKELISQNSPSAQSESSTRN